MIFCSTLGDCKLDCTTESKQVCGSDGKTYLNKCKLDAAQCNEKKPINVIKTGPCGKIIEKFRFEYEYDYEIRHFWRSFEDDIFLKTRPQTIELLDIECALCHVTGVQFDKKIFPYKSAILDFLQKLPFAFAQNVLGRANFSLINPPFCGDNFFTDTR